MKANEKSKDTKTPYQERTLLVERLSNAQESADYGKNPIVRAISKAVSHRLVSKIDEIDRISDELYFGNAVETRVDSIQVPGDLLKDFQSRTH